MAAIIKTIITRITNSRTPIEVVALSKIVDIIAVVSKTVDKMALSKTVVRTNNRTITSSLNKMVVQTLMALKSKHLITIWA